MTTYGPRGADIRAVRAPDVENVVKFGSLATHPACSLVGQVTAGEAGLTTIHPCRPQRDSWVAQSASRIDSFAKAAMSFANVECSSI
jgi:hypothetical protein